MIRSDTLLAVVVAVLLIAGESALAAPAADFVARGPRQPLPQPGEGALAAIAAPALAAHVAYLASPALAGRGLSSPGLDAAAEYVVAQLALASVRPARSAAAGGYFATVPLRRVSDAGGSLVVERQEGGTVRRREFAAGVDCRFAAVAPQGLRAPVVFAGRGIREAALGHDDYRGLDVRGKVVVVLPGLPAGVAWQAPELVARYADDDGDADERWEARREAAAAAGAVAVVAVEADALMAATAPEPSRTDYFLPLDSADGEQGPLLVRVSSEVGRWLLAADPGDPGPPRPLPGVALTLTVTGSERLTTGRNVVAVIPGSDPTLAAEAVVIGAHLDHLGRVGEVVYPGADDNASGVAALLEIARAASALALAPRRTLVLAFWTGEEEGKLGSNHYVRHPLWPLERTVAYVNLDMIGHPWLAEEIAALVADSGLGDDFLRGLAPADFVEPGVAVWAPELTVALARAARATGLALHFDRVEGTGGGSDYRPFARARVPWIRFFGNYFPAYHEPGDRPEALDPGQVERVARLAFATVYLLAER